MAAETKPVSESQRAKASTTVLVVDDDPDICQALEMLLSYEGFEVWTALSGKLALARLELERAAGRRAELVVTDVKMPELDGLALLEKLRELPKAPAVVMISGHGDVATAVDAVRRGALDFLEKPLDQNLGTFAAVGATRRTRRALAGSQAVVVGLIGAVLGVVVGLFPGIAITYPLTATSWNQVTGEEMRTDPTLVIPWLPLVMVVLGVPLLAGLLSAGAIRRAPAMARRAE